MSKVVSLRLKDEQVDRLNRAARRLGRSPSEAAALLLEEALRQRDFAFVEFRDSAIGRQAYIKGTRLAVWRIARLASELGGDAVKVASYLDIPPIQVSAALRYAGDYPAEIEAAMVDSASTVEELTRLIPNLEIIEVDASST
ncbi:MAG: transcriptional regulator [Dehalococcoidia bacterium]|nr:transcriptional regulator [Dehalococcoidia bacterium]